MGYVPANLPDGLTNVWLMSSWTTGAIYHWGQDGWVLYDKVFE